LYTYPGESEPFFPLEEGFHQLFMRLKQNMRARSKGENHQDKYTKTTGLKFVFTWRKEQPYQRIIHVSHASISK